VFKSFLSILFILTWIAPSLSLAEETRVFSTLGVPKANGLNLTLSYPAGWLVEDVANPRVVKQFISERGAGHGFVITLINSSIDINRNLSKKEMYELHSVNVLRNIVPPDASNVQIRTIEIKDIPAGAVEFTRKQFRGEEYMNVYLVQYLFVHGKHNISLQCAAARMDNKVNVDILNKNRQYCSSVVNSMILK